MSSANNTTFEDTSIFNKKVQILNEVRKIHNKILYQYISNLTKNTFIFIPPKTLVENFSTKTYGFQVNNLYKIFKNKPTKQEYLYYQIDENIYSIFVSKNTILEEIVEKSIEDCINNYDINITKYYYSIGKAKELYVPKFTFFNVKNIPNVKESHNRIALTYFIDFFTENLEKYNYMFSNEKGEIVVLDKFFKHDKFDRHIRNIYLKNDNILTIPSASYKVYLTIDFVTDFNIF